MDKVIASVNKVNSLRIAKLSRSIPKIDVGRFNIPTIDVERFNIPKIDVGRFNIPTIDVERFNIPTIDVDATKWLTSSYENSRSNFVNVVSIYLKNIKKCESLLARHNKYSFNNLSKRYERLLKIDSDVISHRPHSYFPYYDNYSALKHLFWYARISKCEQKKIKKALFEIGKRHLRYLSKIKICKLKYKNKIFSYQRHSCLNTTISNAKFFFDPHMFKAGYLLSVFSKIHSGKIVISTAKVCSELIMYLIRRKLAWKRIIQIKMMSLAKVLKYMMCGQKESGLMMLRVSS